MSQWDTVANEIFANSLEIHPDEERLAYVDRNCGDDLQLRNRVLKMLQTHSDAGNFLQDPAPGLLGFQRKSGVESKLKLDRHSIAGDSNRSSPDGFDLRSHFDSEHVEQPGDTVGPYELLEVIGVGGMGAVWRAQQKLPVFREVAIKLIKGGMDTRQVIARFEAERQALAMMDHPNIARFLDASATKLGRPYFVMELVEGDRITSFCDTHQLNIEARLRLFVSVCDAVQHAHLKGVIHRDIKPSNVLVSGNGENASTKIIDFGLAKATGHKLTDLTIYSAVGLVIGTPTSMSPEQATMSNQDIDTRSDVYSLGVLLYELLTGVTPFEFKASGHESYERVLRAIREDDPPSLSSRMSGIGQHAALAAGNRKNTPHGLRRILGGDLQIIVHKALEKDRKRRYQTPGDFANDIERFLNGEAIEARAASRTYRMRKTAAKNRVAVTFVLLLVVSLLAGTVASALQLIRAKRAETQLAEQLIRANELTVAAEKRTRLERWERYRSTMDGVSNAMNEQLDAQFARRSLDVAPLEHRGWEWSHFDSRLRDPSLAVLDVGSLDFSYCPVFTIHPHRSGLALQQPDGSPVFWDAGENLSLGKQIKYTARAAAIAYSPNGDLVAVADDEKHIIRIWDVESNQELSRLSGHERSILSLRFSPDGTILASGGFDNRVQLWDVHAGELLFVRDIANVCTALDFNRKGSELFVATGREVIVLNVDKNEVVNSLKGPTRDIAVGRFGTSKSILACGTSDPENKVFVWDMESGECVASMEGHSNQITGLAFNSDCSQIASVSLDRSLRTWNIETGEPLQVFQGHLASIYSVDFSPDGKRIVTGSMDDTARVWDSISGDEISEFNGHAAQVSQVAYSRDGNVVYSAAFDGTVRVWDPQWDKSRVLRGHKRYVYDVAFHPLINQVASVAWDGKLVQWNLASGLPVNEAIHEAEVVTSVEFDSTGTRLVTLSRRSDSERVGRNVMIWDQATGKLLRTIPVPGPCWLESRAAVSRESSSSAGGNDSLIAVGTDAGEVHIFELETGQERGVLEGHSRGVFDLAFRPISAFQNGNSIQHLASVSEDLTVRIWDVDEQICVATLTGHKSDIIRVVYSQDGQMLATASKDKTVRLWDANTFALLSQLPHGSAIYGLAFSPDGKRLASGCADNTIRLWDVARAQEVAKLLGHQEYVHAVSFSPDGTRIASASGDSTCRIWDTLAPFERAGLQ